MLMEPDCNTIVIEVFLKKIVVNTNIPSKLLFLEPNVPFEADRNVALVSISISV